MQFAADLNKVQASLGSKYPITLYAIDLNKREKGEGKIPWADLNRILIKAKAAASRSCFPTCIDTHRRPVSGFWLLTFR